MIGEKAVTEVIGLGRDITGVFSELVEDKDLAAKLTFEFQKLQMDRMTTLMTMPTQTKTDAFIKIVYAFNDVGMKLLRPLGSGVMSAFAGYCILKGIDIPDALIALMGGAFPAWMADRGFDKHRTAKAEERVKVIKAKSEIPEKNVPIFIEDYD